MTMMMTMTITNAITVMSSTIRLTVIIMTMCNVPGNDDDNVGERKLLMNVYC